MASNLDEKIVNQLEYYFGDINLPRDKFMQEKIKEDDGWITLEVLLTFSRLANLSKEASVIIDAIAKCESQLLEVSEDKAKIRRSVELPLPEFNDEYKKKLTERTAYAKGFPKDEALDDILKFLKEYGPVDSCIKRNYLDKATKKHCFKNSCFIIFKDVELCKKFIEAESIKYNDVELIRKWQADYFAEKKQEYEERKNKKNKKANGKPAEEKESPPMTVPEKSVVKFTGIQADDNISREDIKEKLVEVHQADIQFIDFSKGLLEGYIRFVKENAGEELLAKLPEEGLSVGNSKLAFTLVDGEDLKKYLAGVKELIMTRRQNAGQKKRKGKFGGGKGKNKKQRN